MRLKTILENNPNNEYNRVVIEVETLDGKKELAYVYQYNDQNLENQRMKKYTFQWKLERVYE